VNERADVTLDLLGFYRPYRRPDERRHRVWRLRSAVGRAP